jgi:hypothetical protein
MRLQYSILLSIILTLLCNQIGHSEETTYRLNLPTPQVKEKTGFIKTIRELENQTTYHRESRDLALHAYENSQAKDHKQYWLKKAIEEEANLTLMNLISSNVFLQRDQKLLKQLVEKQNNWIESNYQDQLKATRQLLKSASTLSLPNVTGETHPNDLGAIKNTLNHIEAYYKTLNEQIFKLKNDNKSTLLTMQEMRGKYMNLMGALNSKEF